MLTLRCTAFLGMLLASSSAFSFAPYDPIVFDHFGLGTSPLGKEIKSMSAAWNNQHAWKKVREVLATYVGRQPSGSQTRDSLEKAGLECLPAPAMLCSYTGIVLSELRNTDGPTKRTGWRVDIAVNYEKDPWEVKAYGRYIFGSPFPAGDTETFQFPETKQ